MHKNISLIPILFALSACGGGGSGDVTTPPPSTPTQPTTPTTPVSTPSGATFATGTIEEVAVGVPSGTDSPIVPSLTIAPESITFSGNNSPSRASYDAELTTVRAGGRSFSFVEGADGASFALIGVPKNNAGSYMSAATEAPTSGTGTFDGAYFGRHDGARTNVSNPFIEGDIALTVDFSNDDFSGEITNRSVIAGNPNVDIAVMEEDVSFSGRVSGTGVIRGEHFDGNSSGDINGVSFADGVVGTVAVNHDEGLTSFNGSCFGGPCDIKETGVFAAD